MSLRMGSRQIFQELCSVSTIRQGTMLGILKEDDAMCGLTLFLDAVGEDFYNSKVKNPMSERAARMVLGRRNAKSTDWIPGDRGYVENDYLWKQIRNGRKMNSLTSDERLQLGENFIYMGVGTGWSGYNGKVETKTSVDAWVQQVRTFETNKDRSATLLGDRLYPKIGGN